MVKAADGLGFVYFIEAEGLGLVKIGRGNDTKKRLSQLQVGSPVPLIMAGVIYTDDNATMEAQFHERFADRRVRGEWFQIDDELRGVMGKLLAPEFVEQGWMQAVQLIRPQPAPLASVRRRDGESDRSMLKRFFAACAEAGVALA